MKIYTKTGDDGTTGLVDGTRISKAHLRLDAYGSLDELNSHVGLLIVHLQAHGPLFAADRVFLIRLQNTLFALGSHLALSNNNYRLKLPPVTEAMVTDLEHTIDQLTRDLPPLKNFILPGGPIAAAQAHICRTVCRRCERLCVELNDQQEIPVPAIKILNRMSDYLFTLARSIHHQLNIPVTEWKPE